MGNKMLSTLLQVELVVVRDRFKLRDLQSGKPTKMLSLPLLPLQLDLHLSTMLNRLLILSDLLLDQLLTTLLSLLSTLLDLLLDQLHLTMPNLHWALLHLLLIQTL